MSQGDQGVEMFDGGIAIVFGKCDLQIYRNQLSDGWGNLSYLGQHDDNGISMGTRWVPSCKWSYGAPYKWPYK